MSPSRQTESLTSAEQDRSADSLKATVVLSAVELDPGWGEDDPPTTEHEILAAVVATRQEIATGNLDTVAAMDLIAHRAQFLTDARGAVVELLEGSELVYRAASGIAAKSLGFRVVRRKSLSGLCFHTGEAMRCDDTEKDDRVDKAACRWVGIRSMVLVPLVQNGTAVGVLAVISPAVAAFGDRDVQTLWLMAELLASAVAGSKA